MSKIGRPRAPRRRYRSVHRLHYNTRKKHLPVVGEESAGGVIVKVEDGVGYAAIIARRNRHGHIEWCLPKGHIEIGEHIHDTAVREVFEETGIKGRVLAPLATIDYWFCGAGRYVHKIVHHFLLQATGGTIGVENDPDHEAESAAWIRLDELDSLLVYANERKVVARALELLHEP
ncbi:MAG: NUDIX hydrolase [Actinomycetaceae bacterium]|nr:NUDIX hydrolase [Actinomycetaceae bacterium]